MKRSASEPVLSRPSKIGCITPPWSWEMFDIGCYRDATKIEPVLNEHLIKQYNRYMVDSILYGSIYSGNWDVFRELTDKLDYSDREKDDIFINNIREVMYQLESLLILQPNNNSAKWTYDLANNIFNQRFKIIAY